MIYIASPYSHPDPTVMDIRADVVGHFAVHCFRAGNKVYCPIASWHHLAMEYRLDGSYETWRGLNMAFLRHASELWILHLEGWDKSRGVSEELQIATALNIPVRHFEDDGFEEIFPKLQPTFLKEA